MELTHPIQRRSLVVSATLGASSFLADITPTSATQTKIYLIVNDGHQHRIFRKEVDSPPPFRNIGEGLAYLFEQFPELLTDKMIEEV